MKVTTTISIDQQLLERARKAARAQKRSLSSQLERWLEERFDLHHPTETDRHANGGEPRELGTTETTSHPSGHAQHAADITRDHTITKTVHALASHSTGAPKTRGHRRQEQPLAKAAAKGNAVSANVSARGCATELATAAAPATSGSSSALKAMTTTRQHFQTQVAKRKPPRSRA